MKGAIPIYIGTEPAQWLPTEVLKQSILRRTNAAVEFHDLIGMDLGLRMKMYTGFSFYRFAIPECCGYKGRAIYLDADMVTLGDVEELYNLPIDNRPVLAKRCNEKSSFTSVMVMDCERLTHWKVKEWVALINVGLTSYSGCMSASPSGMNFGDFDPLPEWWNHFDFYDETTKLIHYTHVPTQPWKKAKHPYRGAFLEEMHKCMEEGTIKKEEVEREIAKKHIYTDILRDMEEYVAARNG